MLSVDLIDVLRERIKNARRSNTKRARAKDCLCPGNGEASILNTIRVRDGRYRATNELRYELAEVWKMNERETRVSQVYIRYDTVRQPVQLM